MGRTLRTAPLVALALLIASCAATTLPPPAEPLDNLGAYELPPVQVDAAPLSKPGKGMRAVGAVLGFVAEEAWSCAIRLCWMNPLADR